MNYSDVLQTASGPSIASRYTGPGKPPKHPSGRWLPEREVSPAHDPLTEQLTGPSTVFESDHVQLVYAAVDLPLTVAKDNHRRRIAAKLQRDLDGLTANYAAGEVATWDQQKAEADAYTADDSANVPMLAGLAAARGIELAELVTRVHTKADAYSAAAGALLGAKQAAEDLIDAAESLGDLRG